MKYNFQFARNWKTFDNWFKKTGSILPWEIQIKKIQALFEKSVPNFIDWNILWKDFNTWILSLEGEKDRRMILWSEQSRQIETLLLGQMKGLDKEVFVLAYLYKGLPEISSDKMSYWDAVKLRDEWEGNGNGEGGNEFIDKIKIVNLNSIIN